MLSLIDLSEAECRRLLSVGSVGRLAAAGHSGELVLMPLNYSVIDRAVILRTFEGSRLAGELWGAQLGRGGLTAAFEVDVVDHERWRGWSVVAHGTLAPVEREELGEGRLPRPWAAGQRDLFLQLTIAALSGRRLGSGWDAEAAMAARAPSTTPRAGRAEVGP